MLGDGILIYRSASDVLLIPQDIDPQVFLVGQHIVGQHIARQVLERPLYSAYSSVVLARVTGHANRLV